MSGGDQGRPDRAAQAADAGTAPGQLGSDIGAGPSASPPAGDSGALLPASPLAGAWLASRVSSPSTAVRWLISRVLVAASRLSSPSIRRSSAACGPASQIPHSPQCGMAAPAGLPQPGQRGSSTRDELTAGSMSSTLPGRPVRGNPRGYSTGARRYSAPG